MTKRLQILLVLIALCVLAGVLWYFTQRTPALAPSEIVSETPTTTISAIDLDTNHWLTYENKEKGFRFKYPKELEVIDDIEHMVYVNEWGVYIPLPGKYLDVKDPLQDDPSHYGSYDIGISEIPKQDYKSKSDEDLLQFFSKRATEQATRIQGIQGGLVALNKEKSAAYFIKNDRIFEMGISGHSPEDLQKMTGPYTDPVLIESAARYPEFLKIFEGIYSTFEVVE
jgi:hypothetical protein